MRLEKGISIRQALELAYLEVGAVLSANTIRQWVKRGVTIKGEKVKVRSRKVGRKWYVEEADVLRFLSL